MANMNGRGGWRTSELPDVDDGPVHGGRGWGISELPDVDDEHVHGGALGLAGSESMEMQPTLSSGSGYGAVSPNRRSTPLRTSSA
jgi:hypothetical protein